MLCESVGVKEREREREREKESLFSAALFLLPKRQGKL